MSDYERVISFWLGDVDEHGRAGADKMKRWWKSTEDFDAEVSKEFQPDHAAIVADEREDWLETAQGRLAYILVLDQFSRNMFRDTPEMYAADERARKVVHEGIERGHDKELPTDGRAFFYMPLMHSEDMADQDKCLALFEALAEEVKDTPAMDHVGPNINAARQHRKIVGAWGRFPHRNEILGRETTPEEAEFLKKPGSSF